MALADFFVRWESKERDCYIWRLARELAGLKCGELSRSNAFEFFLVRSDFGKVAHIAGMRESKCPYYEMARAIPDRARCEYIEQKNVKWFLMEELFSRKMRYDKAGVEALGGSICIRDHADYAEWKRHVDSVDMSCMVEREREYAEKRIRSLLESEECEV